MTKETTVFIARVRLERACKLFLQRVQESNTYDTNDAEYVLEAKIDRLRYSESDVRHWANRVAKAKQ